MEFNVNVKVSVFNLPPDYKKYVVARYVDGKLWFWGSWDDKDRADEVAEEIGGIVTERIE